MTDRQALLAAILTYPADDTPRLVYADWLEENGEAERAVFIRDQRWLAMSHESGRKTRTENRRRRSARSRTLDHGALSGWFGTNGLATVDFDRLNAGIIDLNLGDNDVVVSVSRGFISAITCSWSEWLAHADVLVWWPWSTMECSARITDTSLLSPRHPSNCTACVNGRVPRPIPPTAQPIVRVKLTTWPNPGDVAATVSVAFATSEGHRFCRMKCSECDGKDARMFESWRCPECHGQPLNEWTCERWPRQVFEMPQAADVGDFARITGQLVYDAVREEWQGIDEAYRDVANALGRDFTRVTDVRTRDGLVVNNPYYTGTGS